jgi:histidinol dehydrogenase
VAQSILITDDAEFADAVIAAVEVELQALATQATARQSWDEYGIVIVVDDLMGEAPALEPSRGGTHRNRHRRSQRHVRPYPPRRQRLPWPPYA